MQTQQKNDSNMIGAAAIQAGSGLLGSVTNSIFQGRQNKLNRQFAENQANLEYRRNLDMWNMQNAYNDPSKQMERLKNAGLNPHLMYGKGTVGNSTQLPQYSQAKWEGKAPQIQVPQMIGTYYDLKHKKAVTDAVDEQAEVNRQNAAGIAIKNQMLGYKAQYANEAEKYNLQMKRAGVIKRDREIEEILSRSNLSKQKYDQEKFKFDFMKQHGYKPDTTPSLWKFLYDAFSSAKDPVKAYFDSRIKPKM